MISVGRVPLDAKVEPPDGASLVARLDGEAVAPYDSAGWTRIPPFGRYRHDPLSIRFRTQL